MALNLPQAKTTFLATIGGDKIDLGFTVGQLVPALTMPTILDVAKNTSGTPPTDWQAMRFYQLAKPGATVTYKDGSMVVDPASLAEEPIKINVVQLAPNSVANKIIMKDMDFKAPGLKDALAKDAGTWIYHVKTQLEIAMYTKLVSTAQAFNTALSGSISTWAQGAHYVQENITDFDGAKASLRAAVKNFSQIGLQGAKTETDRNNKFAAGIMKDNMLAIVSEDFLDCLTKNPNLLASDLGYSDIFKNMNIKRFMGINLVSSSLLPEGINFIIVSLGDIGAFAYEPVAGGLDMRVVPSAQWSSDLKAEMKYNYIAGIVNQSFIFASVTTTYQTPQTIYSLNTASLLSDEMNRQSESFSLNRNNNNSRSIQNMYEPNNSDDSNQDDSDDSNQEANLSEKNNSKWKQKKQKFKNQVKNIKETLVKPTE